jgi:hypothetical protein
MKSSLSCTATAALRGFKGWFSGRSNSASEMDHIPFVVSACGYRAPEEQAASEMTETGRRWHPGLSLDNFS